MGKQNRYQKHIDPEYQRWGRTYSTFPGVDECVRLIVERKATGAWADIVIIELAENANMHLEEIFVAFHKYKSGNVAIYLLMALENAALPESVDFISDILNSGDERFASYARRALIAIDTKESRRALFN